MKILTAIHKFNYYFGYAGALSWAFLMYIGYCEPGIGMMLVVGSVASVFMARRHLKS